ncbi:MAG: hypothetical protein OJF61_001135 [Rhodanobacteraceae bacterium]|nr:MAG: hypothetical protein OJF61_001135 [Rhodanobacteraceae bacterium]
MCHRHGHRTARFQHRCAGTAGKDFPGAGTLCANVQVLLGIALADRRPNVHANGAPTSCAKQHWSMARRVHSGTRPETPFHTGGAP